MKKIFMYILVVFIVMSFFTVVLFVDEDESIIENNDNIFSNYKYYKVDNLERYIEYKNKYNLNIEDTIIRVNLNLDYPFYTNTKQSNLFNNINILVNKYIYLPSDYIPNNLELINTKYAINNKYLVSEARINFEKLADDALKDGYNIRVISAYRSYDYQSNLYNNYVKKDGIEKADMYSARPGYSEHQTGLVIDIDNYNDDYENFDKTKEFEWMNNNSYKYGFILRYPKGKTDITGYDYESWHYRYVGKEIAKYIYENNITFDEYYAKFID